MKILLIPEFSETGGSRTFFFSLLSYYKKNKEKVILYIEKNSVDLANKLIEQGFISSFLTYSRRPKLFEFFPLSIFWEVLPLIRIIDKVDPDMIFVSNQRFGLWMSIFLYHKRCIYFCHSYPSQMNFVSKITMKWLLNTNSTKNNNLVTVSKFAANSIKGTLGLNRDVKVVYNTSDFVKTFNKKTHDGINISTVSNLEYYKNPTLWLEVALAVVSNMNNVRFIWIGDGPMINTLRKNVPLNYKNRILFVGKKEHYEVKKYLEKTDIYLQPSLVESQGISVIEAMSLGVPCIVSNAGGLPESVENNINGIVVNNQSVDNYKNAIFNLIKDDDLRKKMGKMGVNKFKRRFSYINWEGKMEELHKI